MRVLKRMVLILLAAVLLQRPAVVSAQEAQVQEPQEMQVQEAQVQELQEMHAQEAQVQESQGDRMIGQNPGEQEPQENQNTGNVQEPQEDQKAQTVQLMIDDQNRYEGMEKTYYEGYIPKVENGTAYLVMPIISSGSLKNDTLRVSLNLGDVKTMPFVCKNYVKSIPLRQIRINDGNETAECYLVSFALELKAERYNGSYPVVVSAKAADETGNVIEKEFTVYLTITDGKNEGTGTTDNENSDGKESKEGDASGTGDPGAAAESAGDAASVPQADGTSEAPSFAPKVVIQSCQFSKQTIQAGDEVKVDITLVNTSQAEAIRNMTVTISGKGEYFCLMSPSDTIYVDSIPVGTTYVVSYLYNVKASTPQGQYDLEIAMDYADSEGASYTGSGKIQVPVEQPIKLQFDPLAISSEVAVADVVEAQVQAMNLGKGKVYNVRAVLEADGLSPAGTLFIGDIEAGTTGTGSTQVSVGSLTEGTALYGKTEGTVTFYYEDEAGKEYEETAAFTTTITSPFSDVEEEAEDETGQWWVIMAVIGIILCMFFVFLVVRRIRQRKQQDEVVE